MALPPIVTPLARFSSDYEPVHAGMKRVFKAEFVFAPDRDGDRYLEVSTTWEGDGPSFVCGPDRAREIAAELIARADRIEARGADQ